MVRELLLGPKRFTDLAGGLPGISQNVLSQRLRELESAGVVHRRKLGPPSGQRAYELSDRGRELEPVVMALARWGSRVPATTTAPLGVDALVLALRTAFDPRRADGLRARFGIRLGDDRFDAEIGADRFHIARGEADRCDAVLVTDAATLHSLVFGGRAPADAEAAADLVVDGDRDAAARFLHAFPRPATAP